MPTQSIYIIRLDTKLPVSILFYSSWHPVWGSPHLVWKYKKYRTSSHFTMYVSSSAWHSHSQIVNWFEWILLVLTATKFSMRLILFFSREVSPRLIVYLVLRSCYFGPSALSSTSHTTVKPGFQPYACNATQAACIRFHARFTVCNTTYAVQETLLA